MCGTKFMFQGILSCKPPEQRVTQDYVLRTDQVVDGRFPADMCIHFGMKLSAVSRSSMVLIFLLVRFITCISWRSLKAEYRSMSQLYPTHTDGSCGSVFLCCLGSSVTKMKRDRSFSPRMCRNLFTSYANGFAMRICRLKWSSPPTVPLAAGKYGVMKSTRLLWTQEIDSIIIRPRQLLA